MNWRKVVDKEEEEEEEEDCTILCIKTQKYMTNMTVTSLLSCFIQKGLETNHMSHFDGIIIITPWEFFTSVLADGFSVEFEWQQASSSFQDSSQYSVRSQYCSSLDGLHSSSYFLVLQSLFQSFGDCTKSTNHNWHKCHFHVL